MPTLDNLWNYLNHFYEKVTPALKDKFYFEDMAGIYTEGDLTRLFAVCTRYVDIDGIKVLPQGKYLCASCSEENREQTLHELTHSPSQLRHRPGVYSAADSGLRHPALEL